MRALAFQDLDRTMYEILSGTLDYLNKKGSRVDSMTKQAFDYYQALLSEPKKGA